MREYLMKAALPEARGLMKADIVLAHLPHNTITPYVTWQMNVEDGGTYWGNYFGNYDEALEGFHERVKRKGAKLYHDQRPVF